MSPPTRARNPQQHPSSLISLLHVLLYTPYGLTLDTHCAAHDVLQQGDALVLLLFSTAAYSSALPRFEPLKQVALEQEINS